MRRSASLLLFFLLLLPVGQSGCVSAAAPEPSDPDREIPARAASAGAGTRGGRGRIGVSCYEAFQPSASPVADLALLTSACGPPAGLAPVTPVQIGKVQTQEEPAESFHFRGRAGRCYRFFAVGAPEVADLDIILRDAEGQLTAGDASEDRWPVVPPRGPLCLEREGVYTVEVSVSRGRGSYVLQVWGDRP